MAEMQKLFGYHSNNIWLGRTSQVQKKPFAKPMFLYHLFKYKS
ncbi:hypothetical protein M23134_00877 [Microscilla marina ATCC 23134]|uniref:Uncharacterized protein n=1 Tax=Microscilla marina ATCC 23134 TaxID=313606 RepID=A1ZUN7_MICM2|nr:hypothetical protein M23134_00877 [Microscilla marina ATCC 23134]